MERRKFIKNSCLMCLAGMSMEMLLQSCGTSKVYNSKAQVKDTVEVPLTEFTPENNYVIVRTEGIDYDILVVKKENSYKALLLMCTHFPNPIYASKNKISCNQHGSSFDFEGNVVNGPATQQLKSYPTSVVDQQVVIHLKS